MSYSAPLTRSTGELMTAAMWNADIRDDRAFMFNRPACQVYRTSNQTITTSTETPVNFDAEIVDTEGMHDPATNNDRITIQTAGVYLIHGMIKWAAAGAVSDMSIQLVLGTTYLATNHMRKGTASSVNEMTASTLYQLAANDIVRCRAYHSLGSNLDIVSDGTYRPRFGVVWLGSGA